MNRIALQGSAPITTAAALAAIALLCCPVIPAVHGQDDHAGDIEVFAENGELMLSRQFVEAEFASENPGTLPFQLDEPGFVSEKEPPLFEAPLPDGTFLGFNVGGIGLNSVVRSLWYWDGGDGMTPPVAADFVASPHQLLVSHPSTAQSVQVDGLNPQSGFLFAEANVDPLDNEVLHSHLVFRLVEPNGDPVLNPAEGIYLFKTSHYALGGASPPAGAPELYWVAGLGVDEEGHELAVDFVIDEFGLIPEPGSALLAGIGALLIGGTYCRRGVPISI